MSEQLKLEPRFAPKENVGAPYAKNSATSKAAAKKVASKVERDRADILLMLMRAGDTGHTWDEMWEPLHLSPTSNGRVTELVEMGLVADSGRTRKTRHGSSATVWIATKKGAATP